MNETDNSDYQPLALGLFRLTVNTFMEFYPTYNNQLTVKGDL